MSQVVRITDPKLFLDNYNRKDADEEDDSASSSSSSH